MRRVLTTIALTGTSAFFSALLVASPAQAAHHSDVATQARHFAECLDLMISDPAKHAQLCGPGHEWTGKFSHEGDFSGTTLPTPPPVIKTEEPCEPPPCEPPCWHPPCWDPCEGGEAL
jgi:hypothetical protein